MVNKYKTEEERKEARRLYKKKWGENNKEKLKEYRKKYYEENKEKVREGGKKYYEENKEKIKEYGKKYREENKEKVREGEKKYREENKEKIRERKKKYREDNKEKIKECGKKWREENKEYYKKYREENKEKINKRNRKRTKNDPLFRLKGSIRASLRKAIKLIDGYKSKRTEEILGCSFKELKQHIESQWEDWMTWDNYGLYNGKLNHGWDIDHIEPLSLCETKEDVYKLNHYTNLQPLCSYTNRYIKRDNIN